MSFLSELQRRNVVRVAAGYAVVAWLLVQVATTVLPQFGAPDWIARWLIVALAIGFVPALAFGWMYELTPQGLKTQGEADAAGLASRFSGTRANLAIVLLLVLGLGLFALGRYSATPGSGDGAEAGAPSIAVLPFVNMSADKENVYFSDGLSETLLDMLAQVPALKVSARTSSFAFRDKAEDVRSIGAALGVAHLLEGSVQKAGDQVRITAQLVRTSDGAHVWSRRFDRQLTDVFKIQDEIATEVVGALKVALVGDAGERLVQKRTDNVEAYEAYLKGVKLMPERRVSELRSAAEHFERAIELDPAFARAYVGASDAYLLLAEYGSVTPEQESRRERYLARALELAPDLGEAHASRAVALARAHDTDAAEREFKRAIELAPSYATAYQWYADLRVALGRYDEALALSQRSVELDPLSPIIVFNLSNSQRFAGRPEEARATIARLRREHPEYAMGHRAAADAAADAGDLAQALQAMNDYDRADPDAIGYGLGRCQILYRFLAREEAHACVQRFAERAPELPAVLVARARLLMDDGKSAEALALLDRAGDVDPVLRAVLMLQLGRPKDALETARGFAPEMFADPVPPITLVDQELALVVGLIRSRAGEQAQGRALLERARVPSDAAGRNAPAEGAPWTDVLCLQALGRADEAYAALAAKVAAGSFVSLSILEWEPLLDEFRADPRYGPAVAPARAKAAEQVRLARAAGLI